MRNIAALTWREVHAAFFSPLGYTVATLFLLFSGFFFYLVTTNSGEASLTGTVGILSFLFLVATPFLTMRLLSEEYRSGTIEMLMTAPVTDTEVVIGKFLGAMLFFAAMLVATLVYTGVLRALGRPDMGIILASYLGLLLMGGEFVAVGLFCSALTRNQVVAGVMALVVLLTTWVMGSVGAVMPLALRPLFEQAGTLHHLQAFEAGRIAFRDVFYFVSLTAFWLFLAVAALVSKRFALFAGDTRPPIGRSLAMAAIPAGAVAVLAGIVIYDVRPDRAFTAPIVIGPIVLGLGLVALGGALSARWFRHLLTRRRFRMGLNVWAMAVLAFCALLLSNAIVAGTPQTYGWFFDMSAASPGAFSTQTRNVLAGLGEEVRITVLQGTGEVGHFEPPLEIGSRVRDLVHRYRSGSRHVRVDFLDAYRDRLEVEQLARRVKNKVEADSVVVECAGRSVHIPFASLVELPPGSFSVKEPPPSVSFAGEEKLTSAIVRLSEEKPPTVYFLTGHGELLPEGEEGRALTQFAGDLRRDNYQTATLNLGKSPAVPEDCEVLVIAGPTAAFEPAEVDQVRKYLLRNGKLLLLVRPKAARGTLAGLDRLLGEYNVDVVDREVVIEVYRVGGAEFRKLQVVVNDFAPHPVCRDLESLNVVLENVSPVRAATLEPVLAHSQTPAPVSPWAVTPLLQSSGASWAETNLGAPQVRFDPDEDERGPVALAVAVQRRAGTGKSGVGAGATPRLLVIGSTNVATDSALQQYPGNRAFLMNGVNWLAHKESRLGIPPQRADRRPISVGPQARKVVFLIAVILMPLAAAAAGVLVWQVRQRNAPRLRSDRPAGGEDRP